MHEPSLTSALSSPTLAASAFVYENLGEDRVDELRHNICRPPFYVNVNEAAVIEGKKWSVFHQQGPKSTR